MIQLFADNSVVPNPLGVLAVLSAFNFPVAVYGWCGAMTVVFDLTSIENALSRNLALSLAAGNAALWKPSPSTPLCSIAITKLVSEVLTRNGVPGAVAGLVIGGKHVGEAVVQSNDVDMGAQLGAKTHIAKQN